MSKPIEGCPQPETEIRERAWTAEQAIANLLDRALDAAAFLNAIKRNDRAEPLRQAVHAVWPESAKSMDARFHLSSAFAATLCQQAERGDGAVSAWREEWAGSDPGRGWYIRESTGINGRVVAYLGENITSELVREVIAAHNASLFIGKPEECADACPPQQVCDYCQAVAPLLRAPAEQSKRLEFRFGDGCIGIVPGDVAGRSAVFLTEVAAPGEVGSPIPNGECGKTCAVLTFPTTEQASRVMAALAQNAQGEAVAHVYRMGNGIGSLAYTDHGAKSDLPHGTKLYLRAERARVPDGWKLAMFILQSGLYAKLPEEERAVCDALVQENPYIAAATQPEDAGEVDRG